MRMEKLIYFSEALPEIVIYVTIGIFICLACLCYELYSGSQYKNGKIDKAIRLKRRNKLLSVFFILIAVWVFGFILLLSVLGAGNNLPVFIIGAVISLGLIGMAKTIAK